MEDRLTVVMMMDIDRFKSINDTWGHAEGDRALVIASGALKKVASSHSVPSFLGRYGGDEFIFIIHPARADAVDEIVREIRAAIDETVRREELPFPLSISIGYDVLAGEPDTFQDCLQRADQKLYQGKRRLGVSR